MTDHGRMLRERSTTAAWTRLVTVVAARGVVAMLLGFACWAAGPTLLGWHVTTVVSDSMRPAIAAGDVVAARPTSADALRPGQVLLAPDPDHDDRLRLHRYADRDDTGHVITRGDANADDDSSRIAPGDVLGVGVLRVPLVGKPVVWAQQGEWVPVAVTALVVVGALGIGLQSAVRVPGGSDGDRRRGTVRRRRRWRSAGSWSPRSRRAGAVVAIVVLAALLAVASPVVLAHAAFSATTGQAATFAAAATAPPGNVACATNANGTVTISWQHRGDTAGFTILVDGQPRTSLGPEARSVPLSVRSLFSWSRQSITVRSELDGSWRATSSSVDVRIFSFLGLGTVRCA